MRALLLAIAFSLTATAAIAAPEEIPIPQVKPEKPPEKPKIPETWSENEIREAQQKCSKQLVNIAVEYVPIDPIKKGICGRPALLNITAIGTGDNRVEIIPPATLNCAMTVALAKWFKDVVQPTARMHLKTPVTRISNIASYSCRHRYGNPKKRMSEHAFANALDIAYFETEGYFESGEKFSANVLKHWGPTQRVIKARKTKLRQQLAEKHAQQAALALAATEKAKKAPPPKPSEPHKSNSTPSPPQPATPTPVRVVTKGSDLLYSARQWASKVKLDVKTPQEKLMEKDPRQLFLRRIHDKACGIFGTVLGPEANDAHNNHFHVDMAPRKRHAYCE